MLCNLQRILVFQFKTIFKRDFAFKWKLFQVASLSRKKKRGILFQKKLLPKLSFDPKNHYLKKNSFPKWHLNLLYKILVRKNVFNWYLNMFPKNLGLQKTKWFQNEFWTWFAWVSKALLRNGLSSKSILIEQKCFSPC